MMNNYSFLIQVGVALALLFLATAQLIKQLRQYARGELIKKISSLGSAPETEIEHAVRWINICSFLLPRKDYISGKQLFAKRLELLDRAQILHLHTKDF